jgi:diadenosine tetraphosphate (Ap4A) HIT family hydrolase
MPAWHDARRWRELTSGEACPICLDGPRGLIAELGGSLLAAEPGPVRGYCALFARRHAVELHDLTEAEMIALARDLRNVTRILQQITGAIRINCEIHGNTIPHVHVHIIPRYRGDELEQPGRTLANVAGPG